MKLDFVTLLAGHGVLSGLTQILCVECTIFKCDVDSMHLFYDSNRLMGIETCWSKRFVTFGIANNLKQHSFY